MLGLVTLKQYLPEQSWKCVTFYFPNGDGLLQSRRLFTVGEKHIIIVKCKEM